MGLGVEVLRGAQDDRGGVALWEARPHGGCVILSDQRERRISGYGLGVGLCCGAG